VGIGIAVFELFKKNFELQSYFYNAKFTNLFSKKIKRRNWLAIFRSCFKKTTADSSPFSRFPLLFMSEIALQRLCEAKENRSTRWIWETVV
jgi:hypothetical protein